MVGCWLKAIQASRFPDSGSRIKDITVTPTTRHNVTIEYEISDRAGNTVGSNQRNERVESPPEQ